MRKNKLLVSILGGFVLMAPALASQPGQPLDCSDWVISTPGVSCTMWAPLPCQFPTCAPMDGYKQKWPANDGSVLFARYDSNTASCGVYGLSRLQIWRSVGTSQEVVATLTERCVNPGPGTRDTISPYGTSFDAVNGRLILLVQGNGPMYGMALQGFTTIFDVLQTYVLPSNAIKFRTPAHPEGLRGVDHFDTYWGRVADLPDFSQAHPMQCHYPSTPPRAGDYLTVSDASPRPPPGQANYIVTAGTLAGQKRYGRKKIGDLLSGRDPALLPSCP